jgi:hypothetical protein
MSKEEKFTLRGTLRSAGHSGRTGVEQRRDRTTSGEPVIALGGDPDLEDISDDVTVPSAEALRPIAIQMPPGSTKKE